MTDRDCNFNCLDLFYNELDQCPCMSGKDTNLYQGRVRWTRARTSSGLPHQSSRFRIRPLPSPYSLNSEIKSKLIFILNYRLP